MGEMKRRASEYYPGAKKVGAPRDGKGWAMILGYYLVYYVALYFVGKGTLAYWSGGLDTDANVRLQTRHDSPRMRIFPLNKIKEEDFYAVKLPNTLAFGKDNAVMYKGNHDTVCNWGAIGCEWTKKTLSEAYALEFSERLAQIQAQINDRADGVDCSAGNQANAQTKCNEMFGYGADFTNQVNAFCGDGATFTNNQACFFVGLTTTNDFRPVGLTADYLMGKTLKGGFADETIGNQLNGFDSNSTTVQFGCRLSKTKESGVAGVQVQDTKKPAYDLTEESKYISWMGGKSNIETFYWPNTKQAPNDVDALKNKHRYAQSDWYRPELVMKVDMSSAPESIGFDCNAYANNIKTPMLVSSDGGFSWASRSKFPDAAHQSFTFSVGHTLREVSKFPRT